MITQYPLRFAFVPLTALALLGALFFFIASGPTAAVAAGVSDWQQMQGNGPMTHTMPMTATTPPMMNHQMHQRQGMMGQGMMGHEQAGMGGQMVSMGRRMQMMGMMMQMMGHMQKMMDHMQGMMGGDMPMMQGMMGGNMPMTHTMPMTGAMSMGVGMGAMMDIPMMDMPTMDIHEMHTMMSQMMDQMMAEMHEMHQLHQMTGMDHGAMNHTMPTTNTTLLSDTPGAVQPELTQTAQVGPVEIVITAVNLHDAKADTLDFTIALNSHTTEIDLDLAETAMLHIGDAKVSPTTWETASPKGHHIKGVLRFPRTAEDGSALFTDAPEISLMIGGLPGDVEHTFKWEVHSH